METQTLIDRRMERMAATAEVAGWTEFAEAVRARVGRKPAKTWAKALQKALGSAYDPERPQADKAARAAWLFASRFAEPEAEVDELHLPRRLQTDAYWTERHLAASGVEGVKAKAAPSKAAADQAPAPKPKRKAAKKTTTKAARKSTKTTATKRTRKAAK